MCVCIKRGATESFKPLRFSGGEEISQRKSKESEEETDVSRRLIQPPDMKETCSVIFNYILLLFIEMYMSYLAACKPRITQRKSEKVEERQEKKNTAQKKKNKKKLLKLESLREKRKPDVRRKLLLGTRALSALTPGPCGHKVQGQPDILLTGTKEESQVGVSRLHLLCEKPEDFRGHWHGERTGNRARRDHTGKAQGKGIPSPGDCALLHRSVEPGLLASIHLEPDILECEVK